MIMLFCIWFWFVRHEQDNVIELPLVYPAFMILELSLEFWLLIGVIVYYVSIFIYDFIQLFI